MFMVHFHKLYTKRYDDIGKMGKAIADWLDLHPRQFVKIEKYI